MNIGENIDYLYRVKKITGKLNKRITALKEAAEQIETELIHMIKEQGVEGLHSHGISATISEQSFGQITDYEAFETYLKETDSLFLLQRRLSQLAYNDLKASGEDIPGVKDFTKTTLSLRKR
jgi:hypothetical protein